MRELVAYRKSLTFRSVIGVDADVVLSAIAQGPAGLIRSQIGLRSQHSSDFLNVSLDPNRYAGWIYLAHKLTRLYDCRELIHWLSLRQVFCELYLSVADNPAARFLDR